MEKHLTFFLPTDLFMGISHLQEMDKSFSVCTRLNGKIASVCLTTWLESWKPHFPFSPLSSHSCTISYEPSHIYCEFSCIHLLELSLFFSGILCHILPHGCTLLRCVCFLTSISDRLHKNAFKHQLSLLRILNQMNKQTLLDFYHPFPILSPPLAHTSIGRQF